MSDKLTLLLVEDDINLGTILKEFLQLKGFIVSLAKDGDEGSRYFSENFYNLVILDIMMPKKDGFTLAKEIRTVSPDVPMIFLTARSMQHDVIEGLKIGADDYITKPFSTEELFLRINAILKRAYNHGEARDIKKFVLGIFSYDHDNSVIVSQGETKKLTSKENDLLYLLCLHKNGVLERKEALEKIWGEDNYFNARSMDVYIAKLRSYLKEDSSIEIKNIHGTGYRLNCKPSR